MSIPVALELEQEAARFRTLANRLCRFEPRNTEGLRYRRAADLIQEYADLVRAVSSRAFSKENKAKAKEAS